MMMIAKEAIEMLMMTNSVRDASCLTAVSTMVHIDPNDRNDPWVT
jgi:hypothetical protein